MFNSKTKSLTKRKPTSHATPNVKVQEEQDDNCRFNKTAAIALGFGLLVVYITPGYLESMYLKTLHKERSPSAIVETVSTLTFKDVVGVKGIREEIRRSAAIGQPVLLDFYASWCSFCEAYKRKTFTDKKVISELDHYNRIRVDLSDANDISREVFEAFGIIGLPVIDFYNEEGVRNERVTGFVGPEEFVERSRREAT